MMDNDTVTSLHNINRQYQNALSEIRKAVHLEADERREIAHEVYDRAAAQQSALVDAHVADRDERVAHLTAEVYQGGGAFGAAIAQHATADPDALRRLAAVARRTGNAELYRAAYVLATESDDAALAGSLKRGDPVLAGMVDELDALNEEAAARHPHPMLPSVLAKPLDAPGGPTMRDLLPGREEIAAAQEAERERAEAERRAAASKYARSIQGKTRRQVGGDVHYV